MNQKELDTVFLVSRLSRLFPEMHLLQISTWTDNVLTHEENPQEVINCLSFVKKNIAPHVAGQFQEWGWVPCGDIVETAMRFQAGERLRDIRQMELTLKIIPEKENMLSNLALYSDFLSPGDPSYITRISDPVHFDSYQDYLENVPEGSHKQYTEYLRSPRFQQVNEEASDLLYANLKVDSSFLMFHGYMTPSGGFISEHNERWEQMRELEVNQPSLREQKPPRRSIPR